MIDTQRTRIEYYPKIDYNAWTLGGQDPLAIR